MDVLHEDQLAFMRATQSYLANYLSEPNAEKL
jgi:hypothetical protein